MQPASRYTLLRPLARGGMGEVWLARASGAAGWSRLVVVKRVLPHLEADPDFRARFIDEAAIAARLTHTGIVQVLDLEQRDDGLALVMEWVDGVDLRRLVRSAGALSPAVAAFVAAELCAALDFAHNVTDDDGEPLRLVHRDISPANVLVSRDGAVKLADFGIASARGRLVQTVTGQLRGKFAYMSPEQASGAPVDARSDVFAVGALLFELLTGRRAFDGATEMEVLARVQRGEREPVAEAAAGIGPGLAAAVERALAVDADARFVSAAAFEEALRPHCGDGDRRRLRTLVAAAAPAREVGAQGADAEPGRDAASARSFDALLAEQLAATVGDTSPSAPVAARAAVPSTSHTGPAAVRRDVARVAVAEATQTRAWVDPRRRRIGWVWVALAVVAVAAAFAWSGRPRLVVRSEPPGASVYIDGVEAGVTAFAAAVRSGDREIGVRLDGYAPVVAPYAATWGKTRVFDLQLRPADRPVEFHSVPPGATVWVDDVSLPAGNSVVVPVGVPVQVRMELEGHEPVTERVTFSADARIFTRRLTALPGAGQPDRGNDAASGAALGVAGDGHFGTTDGAASHEAASSALGPEPGDDARVQSSDQARNGTSPSDAGAPGAGPDAAPVAAAPGTVVVRFSDAPRVGTISINGESRGRNDDLRTRYELPAGTHRIRVVNDTVAQPFEAEVTLDPGEEETVTVVWQRE